MKLSSLGSAAAAARGIVMSALSTGSPLSVTLTAGHRLRNGSRVAVAGAALDSGTFGEWSVSGVAAASAVLDGTTGAAALSGTPVMAKLMDRTPFLPGNAAVALIGAIGGAATTNGPIGTVVLEKADGQTAAGFTYTNSSQVATAGFQDALLSGEIAIPAAAAMSWGGIMVEVNLSRYMTMRVSAWTSGSFAAQLMSS